MNRRTLIVFLVPLLFLTSCFKDEIIPPSVTQLEDISVSDHFDWSTGKTVELDIVGLPTTISVTATLSVSLSDGSEIYKGNHAMNHNLSLRLSIPGNEETIKVRYGTMNYTLPIVSGKATLSFIPEIQD